MGKLLRRILKYFPKKIQRFFEMILDGASENYIKISNAKENKFKSYSELKKHQKKMRSLALAFFGGAILLIVGILIGPIIFPKAIAPELYIPNGKGDIIFGNISKNQVSIIFKTLDSANGNIPVASSAFVEVFENSGLTDFVTRTKADEYSVAHIISVVGLEEGRTYYFRITARHASDEISSKTVSSWGEGNDPIKIFTTGDVVSKCFTQADINKAVDDKIAQIQNSKYVKSEWDATFSPTPISQDIAKVDDLALRISEVQNENHIFSQSKVQTIISWVTNMPATTELIYHEIGSGQEQNLLGSSDLKLKHAIVMTTLKPGTKYYFKTKSSNDKKEVVYSDEYSMQTAKAQLNIFQQIGENLKELMAQLNLN